MTELDWTQKLAQVEAKRLAEVVELDKTTKRLAVKAREGGRDELAVLRMAVELAKEYTPEQLKEILCIAGTAESGGLQPFISAKKSRTMTLERKQFDARVKTINDLAEDSAEGLAALAAELAKKSKPAITPAPMTRHREIKFYGLETVNWRNPTQGQIDLVHRSYRNSSEEIQAGMRRQLEAMKPATNKAKQYHRQLLRRMNDVSTSKKNPPTVEVEVARAFRHYEGATPAERRTMRIKLERATAPGAAAEARRKALLALIHSHEVTV